jgi:hypothetical protein
MFGTFAFAQVPFASAPVLAPIHATTGTLIGQFSTVAGSANHISLYPDPANVKVGVAYGPAGIYIGTYAASGRKTIYIFDD